MPNWCNNNVEISTEAPNGSQDRFWNSQLGKSLDDYFGIVESMAEYEANNLEDVHKYSKGEAVNTD